MWDVAHEKGDSKEPPYCLLIGFVIPYGIT
jgi:hypothetical protein